MIKETENYKYNKEEHFYYLTLAGYTSLVGYNEIVTTDPNLAKTLIKMARMLHRKLTDSHHNGGDGQRSAGNVVEYAIYKNSNREVQAVIDSLTMMCEVDYEDDWFIDLKLGKAEWPESVLNPLRNVNILFDGRWNIKIPDTDWALRTNSIEDGGW